MSGLTKSQVILNTKIRDICYTEDRFTFISIVGAQAEPEMHDPDSQGKEVQGWEIRPRQVFMEAHQLHHEHPSLSSAVGGGDKANPRAAFWLGLFLDTNMLFIRNSWWVYWFGKSQHNSRRLIHLPSGKNQWSLPACHRLGQPGSEQCVPSQWPPCLSCYSSINI